jgi:hypothetical protein
MVLLPCHHPQLGGITCTLGPHFEVIHGSAAGPAKKIEGVEPHPFPLMHVLPIPAPLRRRRDHSSLGVLCLRRRVPSQGPVVRSRGPLYRSSHPQEIERVLFRLYRLSVGTRLPRSLGMPWAGGRSRPACEGAPALGQQGVPEEPTEWQGLGRLAYFAVVSESPAKFAGVGCPGLRTGSIGG